MDVLHRDFPTFLDISYLYILGYHKNLYNKHTFITKWFEIISLGSAYYLAHFEWAYYTEIFIHLYINILAYLTLRY